MPAAIHLSPETLTGGPIARVRDGDMVLLDCDAGVLEVEVAAPSSRSAGGGFDADAHGRGHGRDLFSLFRRRRPAELGASPLFGDA